MCIGPDVAERWWFQKRQEMDVDRGPFSDSLSLLRAVALKEIAYLRSFAKPRFPFDRSYRDGLDYRQSNPNEHIQSIEQYLSITPVLNDKDQSLHRPVIRHPDLNPNNIFVSDSLGIISILDWQHVSILPLFLAAGIPKYWQNYGDPKFSMRTVPKLPENFEQMNEEDKAKAQEKLRKEELHFFYVGLSGCQNPPHGFALEQPTDIPIRKIFSHVGEPWEGNNIPLQADLAYMKRNWQRLTDSPHCPIEFSKAEEDQIHEKLLNQEEIDTVLENIREGLGLAVDGWTSYEYYDTVMEKLAEGKKLALAEAETENEREMTLRHWPFDDHDEDE